MTWVGKVIIVNALNIQSMQQCTYAFDKSAMNRTKSEAAWMMTGPQRLSDLIIRWLHPSPRASVLMKKNGMAAGKK